MKRILFILPLSILLTYCSSTKPVTTPGVSNVQVNGMAATTTNDGSTNRDWSYKASHDTGMNGNWQLAGMMLPDGSWKAAETWKPVDTTMMNSMDSSTQAAMSTTSTPEQTASTKKDFGGKLYDTSTHFFDTAAYRQTIQASYKPFNYWQRVPEMKIMADLGIFTGNTGCNSMSGSFNFSGNDIKVNPKIRTSKMACNDYDESAFLNSLVKVDNYNIINDMLELKQGNTTVLTFKRKL
ncbi:MAG: META domain-containing protein [Chitinophagaceae bacterium]|nr:META domain-containing protein [Chitinophagaceae bacterium]